MNAENIKHIVIADVFNPPKHYYYYPTKPLIELWIGKKITRVLDVIVEDEINERHGPSPLSYFEERTGLSRHTIGKALKFLKENHIIVESQYQRSREYHLNRELAIIFPRDSDFIKFCKDLKDAYETAILPDGPEAVKVVVQPPTEERSEEKNDTVHPNPDIGAESAYNSGIGASESSNAHKGINTDPPSGCNGGEDNL